MDDNGRNNKDDASTTSTALKDLAIKITKNIHVRMATIVAMILFAIGGTWGFAQIIINQKNEFIEIKEEAIADLEVKRTSLNTKYIKLAKDFSEIKKSSKVPSLLKPVSGKKITGRFITFRWKYDINPGFENFILELKHITPKGEVLKRRYQIPDANRKKMDFELPLDMQGEFFWRIGTGEMLVTEQQDIDSKINPAQAFVKSSLDLLPKNSFPSDTRLWSRYGNFHVYKSVYDKIKTTGELDIGMTAAFLSYDHTINCNGRPNTFDMDFIEWLAKQLEREEYMNRTLKLIRNDFNWSSLFEAVSSGEVDMAIANITKTVERETLYNNMKFTKGYRKNYQRIIFSKNRFPKLSGKELTKRELKNLLEGATLATQDKTINRKSADHLNKIFKFKHNYNYSSYVDVIDSVRRGKIDFGMIDSVRIETVNYPEIGVVKYDLNPLLKEKYKKLGIDDVEYYAIGVHAGTPKSKLLNAINTILESDDWKRKKIKLKEKYKAGNIPKPIFDC